MVQTVQVSDLIILFIFMFIYIYIFRSSHLFGPVHSYKLFRSIQNIIIIIRVYEFPAQIVIRVLFRCKNKLT